MTNEIPKAMNSNCPKCGSENTQSFEMANKTGTTTGRIAGVGVNLEGDIGVGRGITTQQTEIAKQTAPPEDNIWVQDLAMILLCIVAPIVVAWILFAFIGNLIVSFVAAVVTLIVFGFACWRWHSANVAKIKAIHKAAKLKWEHSWICMKCGNTYYVR